MITNLKTREIKNKQLFKLLDRKYNPQSQSLDLWLQGQNWEQAILDRDWSSLNILILNKCDITALKMNRIIELKWSNLTSLFLSGNKLGSSGVRILVKCNIPKLSQLRINNCLIGDQGAKNLTKGNWKSLKSLTIYNNFILLQGQQSLQYGQWAKLQKLEHKFFTLHMTDPISALSLSLIQSKNCEIEINISGTNIMKQNIQEILTKKQIKCI